MLDLFVNFHFLNNKFASFIFDIEVNSKSAVLGRSCANYIMGIFICCDARIVYTKGSGLVFSIKVIQNHHCMATRVGAVGVAVGELNSVVKQF